MKFVKGMLAQWRLCLPLILLVAVLLLLIGCGGADVQDAALESPAAEEMAEEVEEAFEEVVDEVEEVIEEVEVEKEVEVEVTKAVESIIEATVEADDQFEEEMGDAMDEGEADDAAAEEVEALATPAPNLPATQAPEISATPAPAAGLENEEDLEARGSEEDDGSPFTGSSNRKNSDDPYDVADKISWISAAEADIDALTVRVIANHTDELVIYKTLETDTFAEKIVLTESMMFYSRIPIDLVNEPAEEIFLEVAAPRWRAILNSFDLDELYLAEQRYRCDACNGDGERELLTIITPDDVIRLEIDAGEQVTPIEDLLGLLRGIQFESRVRVRTVTRQFE